MNKFNKALKGLIDFSETLVIALSISALIWLVAAFPNKVEGQSMEPNFKQNQLLLTNKTIQWFGKTRFGQQLDYDYHRGDVVIFANGEDVLIKRIIAVAGDSIRIENNRVFLNNELLDEKYLPTTTRTQLLPGYNTILETGETLYIPEGRYFLMGDNRENSRDSRYAEVGLVSREQFRGKVFLRYWPLDKFDVINTD